MSLRKHIGHLAGLMLLFGYCGADACGQQYRIDSLETVLEGRIHDTLRVNIQSQLCDLTWRSDISQAQRYGEAALSLAERIGFRRGALRAHKDLSWAVLEGGDPSAALDHAQKAMALGEVLNWAVGTAWAHDRAGMAMFRLGLMDSAMQHFNVAEKIARTVGHAPILTNVLINTGNVFQLWRKIDEARTYYLEAIKCARANGLTISEATASNNLGNVEAQQRQYTNALKYYRNAQDLNLSLDSKTGVASCLSGQAGVYLRLGKPDSALHLYEEAYRIGLECNYQPLLVGTLINLGLIRSQFGKLEQALRHFLAASELAEETKNLHALSYCLVSMGTIHFRQERYRSGLPYLRRALRISEKLGDKRSVASTLHDLGLVMHYLGRNDSARSYLRRSIVLHNEISSPRGLVFAHESLGRIAFAEHDLDNAALHYEKAERIARELGENKLLAEALPGLAKVRLLQGNRKHARSLAEEAQTAASESGEPERIRDAAKVLSEVCSQEGDFRSAYEAQQLYTAMKDSLLNEKNARILSDLSARYEADQREKQIALLEKDKELKDLTLAQQTEQLRVRTLEALRRKQQIGLLEKDKEIQSLEIARHQADYARQTAVTEQRENEVRLLTKDKQLQASLLERETFRRNAILGGLLALLIVAGLIFYRLRERKKANTRLSNTLSELRRTQDQLIHSEKMATLGELTAGIAHEIKNPLNFVTNFSTLSGEMVDELETQVRSLSAAEVGAAGGNGDSEVLSILDDLKGNMSKIQEHGRRADGIVASMLLHARSQKGVRQESDINVLLKEAVQLAWHGMRAQVPDFTVDIHEQYAEGLPKIEVIPQEMSRVFLNLLSNAFQAVRKRALQDGDGYSPIVKVSTTYGAETHEVRIWDNGPGIPTEIREKIFQPFFTTKPTGEGTGLGLSLSYDIVVKGHGGEIYVESEEKTCSEFIVSLPGEFLA